MSSEQYFNMYKGIVSGPTNCQDKTPYHTGSYFCEFIFSGLEAKLILWVYISWYIMYILVIFCG